MAGSSAVLEDGSLLSRIDKGLLRLETVFALVSGIAVFMLMVLAVWSVGCPCAHGRRSAGGVCGLD